MNRTRLLRVLFAVLVGFAVSHTWPNEERLLACNWAGHFCDPYFGEAYATGHGADCDQALSDLATKLQAEFWCPSDESVCATHPIIHDECFWNGTDYEMSGSKEW